MWKLIQEMSRLLKKMITSTELKFDEVLISDKYALAMKTAWCFFISGFEF